MLRNKHFIVALIITPILSIIAYFAADIAVSEKPHAAQKGQSYRMVSQSNCRYTSGLCNMENGDFKIRFRSEKLVNNQLELSLQAKYPVDDIKVSLVDSQELNIPPLEMQPRDQTGKNWFISLPQPTSPSSWLRVVVKAEGTLYYGETQMAFIKYETLFTK
ncbi:hypothetical protein [Vibrio hepatarius]|uniref:hypothetical protein n=1 Tax=Vibrio hepatarius TaxID=171383 RepID=UPI001C08419E|nr:hypothetical protein [Vibrio hepatarius]MBU2895330.1 hypothetical protein [Vibrio hepatarius]